MLKKYWPTAYKVEKGDVNSLILQIVILAVVCIVAGALIGILAKIPVLGVLIGIVGSLVDLYGLVGILLCVLKYLGKVE